MVILPLSAVDGGIQIGLFNLSGHCVSVLMQLKLSSSRIRVHSIAVIPQGAF